MWLLTNITTGTVLIVIREKSKYAVGRVGADLVISDDSSISRTHAFLNITANEIKDTSTFNTNQVNDLLELEDAGSKYGTFHNDGITKGTGIPKQKKITLSDGDRIRFGVLKSVWKVSNITPFVAISKLPAEHGKLLQQYMNLLGGCVLSNWDEKYTHLTLTEINLTSKLLHALLDQKPIVTCEYWGNMVQTARRGRRSMPQLTAFMPPNPNDIDVSYRIERLHLFKNLTFVFLNGYHYKTYAPIVEKAGGKSKHLNAGIQKSFLVRKDVVVIQYVPSTESQSSQTINTLEETLKLHSRRTVPEFEIGLAIIHCSTKKYCNPSHNPDGDLDQMFNQPKSKLSESSKQTSSVLTNSSIQQSGDETEVFIPETDQKSTTSTNLINDKSSLTKEQTGVVPVESQTFEPERKDLVEVTMSSLQVSESVQELKKRKRAGDGEVQKNIGFPMDTDDDDLFNFVAKKAHIESKSDALNECRTRQQRKSTSKNLVENPTTSAAAAAGRTPKSSDKILPVEINKQMKTKKIDMSGFLEKSQAPVVDQDDGNQNVIVTTKQGTKRSRIAVIDNSDDDDLFCFGGEDESSHNAKRSRSNYHTHNDSDEDLFNFGGADDDHANKDVVDAEASSNRSGILKNNHRNIVMPKPKQLPSKVFITTWLDCSLSALNIKAEEVKKEEEDLQKKDNNDSGVEGDSKDNIEPIKGGCVVRMLNVKSFLHERESSSDRSVPYRQQTNANLDGEIKNFKKFSKKFQPQNRRVIRPVSSTVCGSLI